MNKFYTMVSPVKTVWLLCLAGILFFVQSAHAQWQTLPNFSQSVNSILKNGSTVMVGTDAGIYYTTNEGTNWSQATGISVKARGFAKDGNNILVAGYEKLYRSSNNGAAWTPLTTIYTNQSANTVLVNDGTYIVGFDGRGIWTSPNKGETWISVETSNQGPSTALAIRKNVLYAAYSFSGKLQRSHNNGESWVEPTGSGITIPNGEWFSWPDIASLSVKNDSVLIAGVNMTGSGFESYNGVYVSTNEGDTWQKRSNGLTTAATTALATIGNVTFAGTDGGGVFYTKDDGNTWTAFSTSLTNKTIRTLHISGATLYAGAATGVFKASICALLKNSSSLAAIGATTVTAGDSIKLLANTAGATYAWVKNGTVVPGWNSNIAYAKSTGTYKAGITYATGCTDSTNAVSVIVNKLTPVITWKTPAAITYGTALTTTQLNATANVPGTFTYEPAINTVLNAGANQTLQAHFTPANEIIYKTVDTQLQITVNKAPQTIAFEPVGTKLITDEPFTLTATASSSFPVTFSIADATHASLNDNVITPISAGSVTVTASQAGNSNYIAAGATQTFCISPLRPEVSVVINDQGDQVITSSSASGNQWYLNGNVLPKETNVTLTASWPGKYSVAVVAGGCASERSEEITSIITAILPEYAQTAITCYPNPTSDRLTIDLRNIKANQPINISVVDARGQRTLTFTTKSGQEQPLDISTLPAGLYLLKIEHQGIKYATRFVKH